LCVENLVLDVDDHPLSGEGFVVRAKDGEQKLVNRGQIGDLKDDLGRLGQVKGQVGGPTVERQLLELLGNDHFGGDVNPQDDGDEADPKTNQSLVGEGVDI